MTVDEPLDAYGTSLLETVAVALAYPLLLGAVVVAAGILLPSLESGSTARRAVVAASALAVLVVASRVVRRLELAGTLLDRWT